MPSLAFFDSWLAGATCYPILWYQGQVLNGSAYEAFTTAHWSGYAAAATVTADGNGGFSCPVPAGAGDGPDEVTWYKRAGGSPATSDEPVYFQTYAVPAPVNINLAQPITDVKTATVGGSLAGAWATAWGKVAKDMVTRILKLWGPGNTTSTPSATFLLDNVNSPTTKTPQ